MNEQETRTEYILPALQKAGWGIVQGSRIREEFPISKGRLIGHGQRSKPVKESDERVTVIVQKQFVSKDVVRLMDKASSEFTLKQKEVISLGLLAQQQSYTAQEISSILNQNEEVGLRSWLGRLVELGLVVKVGKGKGTQYAVNPEFIRKINFKGKTNLKNIEDYRLEELIHKDLKAYPNSGFSDLHQRIGAEINQYKIKRMLKLLVEKGILDANGGTKGMKYQLKQKL